MQEGPKTPPGFVASVGFGIGRCLRRLSEQVQQLGRSARTGFQGVTYTEERHVRPAPLRPTIPVRAFGFFLVGSQAIALMLMLANDGSPGVQTSGGIALSPPMIGLAIAGLWSFPTFWNRIPFLIRKVLLLVMVLFVGATFSVTMTLPLLRKLVASVLGMSDERYVQVVAGASLVWTVGASLVVLFSRRKPRQTVASGGAKESQQRQERWANVPSITYADVGGMERQKERIRAVVQNRLHPERYYGTVQNGILLYGPQGTGKTFLAQATAGEFGLNYYYLRSTELIERWVGAPEANVRDAFVRAAANRPILLFIDELDSLGSARQQVGRAGDPGGAGRMYNAVTIQLMQSIDSYRSQPGLVIMAATNFLDAVDPALIRDGRFDVRERVDLPDEPAIARIFQAQLAKKPHDRFALEPFAKRIPGASAARIRGLVDRAAAFAAEQRRKISASDLDRAMEEAGGADRPLFQPVEWNDVVVSPEVEQELRTLVNVLNGRRIKNLDVEAPTGLLLVGPPGVGKTLLARLIATQTRRSFYPITPADVLGGAVGGSVKKLQDLFARAREYAPSILFLDEIDGLLPRNRGQLNAHDVQLVEQALMEISSLEPAHNVFLIGTTNHIDQIDPRVMRGGRFGEKIEIGVPDASGYRKLLERHIGRARLADGLSMDRLVAELQGVSPADLEAICKAAKRFALRRLPEDGDELPPLEWDDFAQAVKRVQVQFS